jgi:hypothetical protein
MTTLNLRPRPRSPPLGALSRRWQQYQTSPSLLRRLPEFPFVPSLQDSTHLFHTVRPRPISISIHPRQYDLFFHKDHNGPLCSHTTRLYKTTLAFLQTSLSCIYSYLVQFGGTFPSLYRISPCAVIYLDIHPLFGWPRLLCMPSVGRPCEIFSESESS